MRRFSVCTCSTAHLPLIERDAIDRLIRDAPRRHGRILVEHDALSIEAHQFGFAVHLGLFDDHQGRPDGVSPELWSLMLQARRQGASWLWFDRDEPPARGLPVFPDREGEEEGGDGHGDDLRPAAPSRPVTICCSACGSAEVMRDAWAQWDDGEQDWVLGAVFDAAFCAACENDATLEQRPLGATENSR